MIETIKIQALEKGSDLKKEEDFYFCPVGTEAEDIEGDTYLKKNIGWTMSSQIGGIWIFSNSEMSQISEDFYIKITNIPQPN